MLTFSYGVGNAQFKIFSMVIPPDPGFRGGGGEAKFHLLVILSGYAALVGPPPIALPQGPHQPKSGPGRLRSRFGLGIQFTSQHVFPST